MKIEKDTQIHLLENLKSSSVKAKNDVSGTVTTPAINTQDKVELSSKRDEVNRLTEKVKAIPDIRPEKVAEFQEAIKNETYNPKGQLVARKILQSQFLDEIL